LSAFKYIRLVLVPFAALRLISLGTLHGQGDAQSVLDGTLDNHPAFDAQHPQRALTDKVDGHQAKETVPPLNITQEVKSEKKAEIVERARLRKKREEFVRARTEELKKESSTPEPTKRAEPTVAATEAPIEVERKQSRKPTETELKEKALREWKATKEGKKLQSLDVSQPTIPPLSR
jgi:hypothetical protein